MSQKENVMNCCSDLFYKIFKEDCHTCPTRTSYDFVYTYDAKPNCNLCDKCEWEDEPLCYKLYTAKYDYVRKFAKAFYEWTQEVEKWAEEKGIKCDNISTKKKLPKKYGEYKPGSMRAASGSGCLSDEPKYDGDNY